MTDNSGHYLGELFWVNPDELHHSVFPLRATEYGTVIRRRLKAKSTSINCSVLWEMLQEREINVLERYLLVGHMIVTKEAGKFQSYSVPISLLDGADFSFCFSFFFGDTQPHENMQLFKLFHSSLGKTGVTL